jgi:hypothetical protein
VGSDGGLFNGGDAGFYGSTGPCLLVSPVVGVSPTWGPDFWAQTPLRVGPTRTKLRETDGDRRLTRFGLSRKCVMPVR